jgi:hypothetical protein
MSNFIPPFGNPNNLGLTWHEHPLIHTLLDFNLAQDLEKKKAEPRTPHFLSLNQDIVARPQEAKCALKYVIHTPQNKKAEPFLTLPISD